MSNKNLPVPIPPSSVLVKRGRLRRLVGSTLAKLLGTGVSATDLLVKEVNDPIVKLVAGFVVPSRVRSIMSFLEEERLRVFFKALDEGKIRLTREVIEGTEFLHRFYITERAVRRTIYENKIRAFAELLTRGSVGDDRVDLDQYEELNQILDELTAREMQVLLALERYEEKHYRDGRFPPEKNVDYLLHKEVAAIWGIPVENVSDSELVGLVVRLERTGCYFGAGWRRGPAKDCRLTALYWQLRRLVPVEERWDT